MFTGFKLNTSGIDSNNLNTIKQIGQQSLQIKNDIDYNNNVNTNKLKLITNRLDDLETYINAWTSAWTAFTPSWSNITVGTGATNNGHYILIGKLIIGHIELVLGTSSSVAASADLILPVTISTDYIAPQPIGACTLVDAGTANYAGIITSEGRLRAYKSDTTYAGSAAITNLIPFTWADGDKILISFQYETI